MKYTVLMIGNNRTIMQEFFTYMDYSFECLSCSDRYDDIMNHLKYVTPDVFVYCLRGEKQESIKRFCNAEGKISEKKIPIVIIGDEEDCEQFKKNAPFINAMVFKKPLSSQNIEAAILKLLKGKGNEDISAQDADFAADVPVSSGPIIEEEEQPATTIKFQEEMDMPLSAPSVRKHILVVDDDSSVLKLIKGFLSEWYDVATAISGKVAMKFLENKKTDLILLDYEMPEENGAEVLNKIRKNKNLKDLPVVFLTGVSDKEKIQDVLVLKPQGYLLKPIDMERLLSTIEGILV